jgi:hypothetical protein
MVKTSVFLTQYCSGDQMRWAGHVALMCERRGVYRVLVGKPEGKGPLGRARRRWENNVNPLNAELNPICHLLILLADLTFMGPCIVSIFQYISNKMQCYTVYLYLETVLYVK